MNDIEATIRHLEALRSVDNAAALDAAIAALRDTALPEVQQRIEAETASDNVQVSAGNDALVLQQITIAEGGRLEVGGRPLDLPPDPEALEQALATYLRTLLQRYQFLNLQGLGAGGTKQAQIALRSVFINLRTDLRIAGLGELVEQGRLSDGRKQATRSPIRLDQLPPDLRAWVDELFTPDEQAVLVAAGEEGKETAAQQRLRARLGAPRTALEVIRHERALVMLGDPGSGKTTVLRHLTLGFAYARLHAKDAGALPGQELAWHGPLPLPVLVQLRRFAASLSGPPSDAGALLDHLQQVLAGDRLEPLARHLTARLEAGELVVLLDGLDEIADETRRTWAAHAAALFQHRFPHSRLVLTSRIYAYREPCLLPPPFRVVTLQPLDKAAADDFVARWYRAALLQGSELADAEQSPVAAKRAAQLVEALDRRPRLREIAANPLLLTMTCLVDQHHHRLPQQRAELYKECLLLLLEQWEQRRAEDGPAGLAAELGIADQVDRLSLIQPIAYQLQCEGHEEATRREVQHWLFEPFFELADGTKAGAHRLIERFLNFLEGRSGLLIARDLRERYAFPHKTFQEYLAARELVARGRMVEEVIGHRRDATWREVILLVAGHLVAGGLAHEARNLAWKLLDADAEGSDDFYQNAVLAGEIVEELSGVPGREGQALKKQVVSSLVQLVQDGRLKAKERVEAAFLLGRLGDPRLPSPEQPAYWCAVEPGRFWYGDDNQGELVPQRLDYGFKIARFPVTNAEYARFIAAGGYENEAWWTPEGWKWRLPGGHPVSWEDNDQPIQRPWRYNDAAYTAPTQPVVGVSWYEAAAYCHWLTDQGHMSRWLPRENVIRLPTSLEWERAARGIHKQRYPWGNAKPTPEHANYRDTGIGRLAPVGCFPLGRAVCEAEDLVGNMCEWLGPSEDAPGRAQKDFTPDASVLLTWSDYSGNSERLCCGSRIRYFPDFWDFFLGFRVVWSLALKE